MEDNWTVPINSLNGKRYKNTIRDTTSFFNNFQIKYTKFDKEFYQIHTASISSFNNFVILSTT